MIGVQLCHNCIEVILGHSLALKALESGLELFIVKITIFIFVESFKLFSHVFGLGGGKLIY